MRSMLDYYPNKLILFLAACTLLIFSGCSKEVDISEIPEINNQLGKRQRIVRLCLLTSGQKTWEEIQPGTEKWFRGAPYQLAEYQDGVNSWRKSGWLPEGTEIELTNVIYEDALERDYIDAIGYIYINGEEAKIFRYAWTYQSAELAIKRAPWENESVPEKRLVHPK